MSYGSKIISYKIAAVRENASRALTFGPEVAAALAKAPKAGETLPDFALLHEVIGRALDDQAAQMTELHQKHHHWRARERHDKARLRAAAVALRDSLRDVRHLFDSFFGLRQGVANFAGRDDLMRLPMHSLENVAAGLLRVLDDDAFGWSASPLDLQAHHTRERLARLLAGYREANTALIESRAERGHAAAERERRMAECEEKAAGMTKLLRGLCKGAGFDNAARSLVSRRPPARRRRRAEENAATPPVDG